MTDTMKKICADCFIVQFYMLESSDIQIKPHYPSVEEMTGCNFAKYILREAWVRINRVPPTP